MIPSEDIKVYKLFGDAIRKFYGGAPINKTSGVGPTLVLHLGQTLVNRLVIQEDQVQFSFFILFYFFLERDNV